MSFYDIDFSLTANKLLPPNKRKTKMKAWLKALMKPLQWMHDLFFGQYISYESSSLWDVSITYDAGLFAVWDDGKIYESLQDGNIGHLPTGDIDSADWWAYRLPNFIPLDERIYFNGQIMTLEYALNRWFLNPGNPRIYIGTNAVVDTTFLMATTNDLSSTMTNPEVFQGYFMSDVYTPITYDFTIYVPLALWTSLASNDNDREYRIRRFVDIYKATGIIYNITTY